MAQEQAAEKPLFSKQALMRLILPLMAEQLLLVTVGMADTVMVSSVGEAAVSGVSLVDQINVLLIQIFAALATGGAVVASQYLGRRQRENACTSARQLVYVTLAISTLVGVLVLVFNGHILTLVFGHVATDVLHASETYFWLSALSYPFIALYNAGAALFRSMGNSKVSLAACTVMNIVNIGGNAVFIYGLGLGVAGAALASLASRIVASGMILYLLHNPTNPVYLQGMLRPTYHRAMVKSILRVGVPNGLENGMFQIGKLLVMGLIASFGTASIAANAICNNLASFSNVPGSAVGLAMITVVGQCVGAVRFRQARRYTWQLLAVTYVGMGLVNVAVYLLAGPLVGFYDMPQETTDLALSIVRISCVVSSLVWQPSFVLPNALRAAGDVKYTMTVSMASMWIFRIGMSYVLGRWMGLGLLGVWLAMMLDWVVRGGAFLLRFCGHRWERAKIIEE